MEFKGRVKKLLEIRQGVSQRTGNEWKALPFIFEYFENDSDRYADSVVLETFDTQVINNLKEGMEVICGFGHRVREYEGKSYNELRLYKIQSVKKAASGDKPDGGTDGHSDNGGNGNQGGQKDEDDDLPF